MTSKIEDLVERLRVMSQTLTTSDLCVTRNKLDKEAADRIATLEDMVKRAADTQEVVINKNRDLIDRCLLAEKQRDELAAALEAREKENEWQCPIQYPDCKENCGGYGCGN